MINCKNLTLASVLLCTTLSFNTQAKEWKCAEWVGHNKSVYYDFRSTNAIDWYRDANVRGFKYVTKPQTKSAIIVDSASVNDGWGHVMYVERLLSWTDTNNYTVLVSHANRHGKGKVQPNQVISIKEGKYFGTQVKGIIHPKSVSLSINSGLKQSYIFKKNEWEILDIQIRNNGDKVAYTPDIELVAENSSSTKYIKAILPDPSYVVPSLAYEINPDETQSYFILIKANRTGNGYAPVWTIRDKYSKEKLSTIRFSYVKVIN